MKLSVEFSGHVTMSVKTFKQLPYGVEDFVLIREKDYCFYSQPILISIF